MRQINELTIEGEPTEIARLAERLERDLPLGWKRESSIEELVRFSINSRPSTYFFSSVARPEHEAVTLFLRWKNRGKLFVSSLSTTNRRGLSDEDYNRLLDRIAGELFQPLASGLDVEIEIHPFRVKLERILSMEALRKLETFSEVDDRTVISPLDRHRWSLFVTQVHMDNSALDSEELDWWLGHNGWPEEQRRRLIEWYEEGLSMLKEYDEARVG